MILDYIEKLELPEDLEGQYHNHLNFLRNLKVGLDFLNQQVSKIERTIINPKFKISAFGNIPGVPPQDLSLVTCAFHWYAISAYNYVLLVGWLAQQVNAEFDNPKKYANRVMPQLVKYRHKVAAHLAVAWPDKKDNKADFLEGLLPVTLGDRGFFVGSWKVTKRSEGKVESGQHDFRWGLTETHKKLSQRYWPDLVDVLDGH